MIDEFSGNQTPKWVENIVTTAVQKARSEWNHKAKEDQDILVAKAVDEARLHKWERQARKEMDEHACLNAVLQDTDDSMREQWPQEIPPTYSELNLKDIAVSGNITELDKLDEFRVLVTIPSDIINQFNSFKPPGWPSVVGTL